MKRRQFIAKGSVVAIGTATAAIPFFNNCAKMKAGTESNALTAAPQGSSQIPISQDPI